MMQHRLDLSGVSLLLFIRAAVVVRGSLLNPETQAVPAPGAAQIRRRSSVVTNEHKGPPCRRIINLPY